MRDYIREIADLLKQSNPVVFYTVGSRTFECIRELKARYGLRPTAVCDKDPRKQGVAYRGLNGLAAVPPEAAASQYSRAYWFIPSLDYRFEIIAHLTLTLGIPRNSS